MTEKAAILQAVEDLRRVARSGAEWRNMVVVVEDNAVTRDVLRETLQLEGYDVFATADGSAALNRLRADPRPAVVLLDLHMEPMSGEEFYRRQQSDPELASIPVILVTAAPPSQRLGLGDLPVVRKPFDLRELQFAIHLAIAGEREPIIS